MTIGATVRGVESVVAGIKRMSKERKRGFAAACYRLGTHVMEQAMPLVPVRSGFLKRSVYVTLPSDGDEVPKVEFGFGAWYAPLREAKGRGKKFFRAPLDATTPQALSLLVRWTEERSSRVTEGRFPTRPPGGSSIKQAGVKRLAFRSVRRKRK